ncbi:hybrid sensor histidine kinase/response regulator [Aquimixticola soesokkakensis]|uniref:hybrid sensor histidine kinase/response regulator n=1 Tax=Aquimixticola soesokkakensis TaxID=1519096 RepID=UPI00135667AC|nr:ATP-binding protein [Aquimixticola soesokkakensis]
MRLTILASLALGLAAALSLGLAIQLDQRARELSVADTDNMTWSFVQLDVDFQSFRLAIARAQLALNATAPQEDRAQGLALADRQSLDLAFNIFYSRVSAVTGPAMNLSDPAQTTARLQNVLQLRADFVDLLDDPSVADAQMLDELSARADLGRADVRGLVLDGLHGFVDGTISQRRSLKRSLQTYLGVSLFLMAVTTAAALVMLVLLRQNRDRNARTQRLASNLAKTIAASPDGVVVLDNRMRVIEYNAAAQAMFGYSPRAILGRPVEKHLVPPARRKAFRAALALEPAAKKTSRGRSTGLSQSGDIRRLPTRALDARGRVFPVEISLTRDQDTQGRDIVICFVRDISPEFEARRKIKAALVQARSDANAKSRFLAVMSHEMRTPMHGVIAALDLLEDAPQTGQTALGAGAQPLLGLARSSAKQALAQIESVLDITRAQAMPAALRVSLPSERFDARAATERLVAQLAPLASQGGNRLTLDWDAPAVMVSRPDAYQKALSNLISNAIKFTRDGAIAVVARRVAGKGEGALQIAVRDEGAGIAPADQRRIFDDFVTLPVEGSGNALGGTGLGLSIARRAAEDMGGAMTLESTLGQGSCFTLTLPFAQDDIAPDPSEFAGKVLVVDDNPVNRQLVGAMFAQGAVVEADDGLAAIRAAYDQAFDVILMDVSMAGLGGIAAARCLRLGGVSRGALIVAVTAHASDELRFETAAAGMDGLVAKPFTRAVLHRRLAQCAQDRDVVDLPQDHGQPKAQTTALLRDTSAGLAALALRAEAVARAGLSGAAESEQEALRREAHRIAGALQMLGYEAMAAVLIEVQTLRGADWLEFLRGAALVMQLDQARLARQLEQA